MVKNSVCCVIVTYNIGTKFYDCFKAIFNQVEQVVIVDNGSDEKTLQVLKDIQKDTNAEVIYNCENLGIAAALNKGVHYAEKNQYSWVLTMDNDSIATEDMIETMLNVYDSLEGKEQIASLFPKYIEMGYASESEKNIKSQKDSEEYKYLNTEIASGNLVKTEMFKKMGYYEEKLFIDMVDHDFCLKLVEIGYKHVKVPGAVLLHNLGKTVKRNWKLGTCTYTNHNCIRRYYITRNRFYFWNRFKHVDLQFIKQDKAAFVKELVKIFIFEDNKSAKFKMVLKGYKDYRKGKFGAIKI